MGTERTEITLYQGENRAVTVTLTDKDGVAFAPTSAKVTIYDAVGTVVVAEQAASVVTNTVSTIVGVSVTATVGKYYARWKIVQGAYTYYHRTIIIVRVV